MSGLVKLILKLLFFALAALAVFAAISVMEGGDPFREAGQSIRKAAIKTGIIADGLKKSTDSVMDSTEKTVEGIGKAGVNIKNKSSKAVKEAGGKIKDRVSGAGEGLAEEADKID